MEAVSVLGAVPEGGVKSVSGVSSEPIRTERLVSAQSSVGRP